MSFDDWKLAYPPEYDEQRAPGCLCGEGDSPCPVHESDAECVCDEADYCPAHGCFPEDECEGSGP